MHALTTVETTKDLRQNTYDMALDWLAAGIRPEDSIVFVQSQVPQVTELHTILSMVTPLGKLTDLPTFKDKVRDQPHNVNYGLLGYPVLMTADIALYKTDVVPVGVDITRGWGVRRSVAADYLYDSPVLLGSQRVGPDLANVGLRLPDANWQLIHLYNPRAVVANSTMPPHRFLFRTRKIVFAPSAEALKLPAGFEPPAGYEVVPTDDAHALVAYLQSLRVTAPLFEAPLAAPLVTPQPEAVTNTVAK